MKITKDLKSEVGTKREDYRLHEFTRRIRLKAADFEIWVVSKEDLILSKLHWARESHSERQLADVEDLTVRIPVVSDQL